MAKPTVTAQSADADPMRYADWKGALQDVAARKGWGGEPLTADLFTRTGKPKFNALIATMGAAPQERFAFLLQLRGAAAPPGAPSLTPTEIDEVITKLTAKVQGSAYLTDRSEFKSADRDSQASYLLFTIFTQLAAAGNGDLPSLKPWFPPSTATTLTASATRVDVMVDLVARCAGRAFSPGRGRPLTPEDSEEEEELDVTKESDSSKKKKKKNRKKEQVTDTLEVATLSALLTCHPEDSDHLGKLSAATSLVAVKSILDNADEIGDLGPAIKKLFNILSNHTALYDAPQELQQGIDAAARAYHRLQTKGISPGKRPTTYLNVLEKISDLEDYVQKRKKDWDDAVDALKKGNAYSRVTRSGPDMGENHDELVDFFQSAAKRARYEDDYDRTRGRERGRGGDRDRERGRQQERDRRQNRDQPRQGIAAIAALRQTIQAKFRLNRNEAHLILMKMLEKKCAVCTAPLTGAPCDKQACQTGRPHKDFETKIARAKTPAEL
jgi:hypothetical protein